jgi:hypothetical protein
MTIENMSTVDDCDDVNFVLMMMIMSEFDDDDD